MEANETVITIHPKYECLWTGINTRYVLITGSRRSSKSYTASIRVTEWLAEEKDWKVLWVRWTMESAEISIIPEFWDKVDLLGYSNDFKRKGDIVTNAAQNSMVIFRGVKTSAGNQTAKLKSIPDLNVFIVEEGEEFRSEKDFNTIDGSVSAQGVPNIIMIIMNPTDIEHWIWDRWFEKSHRHIEIDGHQIPISTHPQVTHIHTTFWDNIENISPEYVDMIMQLRESDPAAYAHRFLGQWLTKKEGVIYPNWIEGDFDESLPYAYGLDLGFSPDPLALVKVAVDTSNMKIYIHEEIYKTKLDDQAALAMMLDRVTPNALVVNDTSEPRLIEMFARHGLNMQNADKGKDSIKEGIRVISGFQIVVTPESYNLKHELRNYVWNDKKASIPVAGNDHGMDGFRYCAMRLLEGSTVLAYSK